MLRDWWTQSVPDPVEDLTLEAIAPFKHEFPGLAPASTSTSDRTTIHEVVQEIHGRLGLVPTTRPADVLATIGWLGPVNYYSDMGLLSAVLRSWEIRFDAFVVGVGFDTVTIAVGKPPSTLNAARAIAAEHFAVCSDNIYQGSGSIGEYAGELLNCGVWKFWWD